MNDPITLGLLDRQAAAVIRAQAYAEALTDLVESLKTCNSFALVSIEPAVRNLLLKADHYSEMAK